MKKTLTILHCFAFLLTLFTLCLAAGMLRGQTASYTRVPLGGGEQGAQGLTAVPLPRVTTSAEKIAATKDAPAGTQLRVEKAGEERRIAALEGKPSGPVTEKMALELQFRLKTDRQELPQLAVLAMERDGGVWYRTVEISPPAGRTVNMRVPLSRPFTRAVFADDSDETIRWNQVERVWVAMLIDEPIQATLDLTRAVFTDEPFRPTSAHVVEGTWDSAHDPAVKDQITVENSDPGGGPCMVYRFTMPGGRHMYAIPRVPVSVEELEGYSGLRFTYRARLPEGISGLLVMLMEADGTQYYAEPAPPGSAEWTTGTIPFDRFQRGGWSKDENDRLDLNEVRHVAIGLHGAARPAEASGEILVGKVEFVP